MPKIRVHELAKELGRDKREIADYLIEKGYSQITAVSNVPEHEVEILRQKYGKTEETAPKETEAAQSVRPEETAKAAETADDKPKKKTIIRVYRAQNASEKLQNRRPKRPARPEGAPVRPEAEVKAAPSKKENASEDMPVKAPEKAAEPVKAEETSVRAEAAEAAAKQTQTGTAPASAAEAAQAGTKAPETGTTEKAGAARETSRPVQTGTAAGRPQQGTRNAQGRPAQGSRQGSAVSQGAAKGRRDGRQSAPRGENQGRDRFEGGRTARPAQGGAKPFGGRGGRPAPQAAPADSSLAKKTSRDYRDKKNDKERDERRQGQNRFGGGRRDGREFNRVPKALQASKPKEEVKKEKVTEITIPERITIRELADRMKIQPSAIVKNLFMKGEIITVNHEVPFEKAEEIAMEFDIIAELEEKEDVIGALLAEEEDDEKTLVSRPPVVCVMGHVDHGKTSLLDAIRHTHVTDKEAGGITQHIGAYMVSVKGQKITFLDTPGHEAFTAMRMRGANSTDIAVLVVAADDGVMPQTVEAINHAKSAGVEIIVAINKIDKPGANIDRVKQELSEYQLIPEEWGGSTIFCPVSARTGEGIDNLLDMIILTAEVNELKANPNRKARGLVLEAKLDKGRGPVATILIQKGTLRQGDFIACGAASGKVRAMTDEKGKTLHKATPSMPVEIIGLSSVPGAGEVLVSLKTDKEAKEFAATFVNENKKELLEATRHQISLDDLFNQIQEGTLKELPIVVKADVQGSVEAVRQSLLKLSNEEIVVKVIHGGVGAINESDVSLAAASNAIIIGFNVRPDATAKQIAEQEKVEIKLYNVIYQAIEDVERAIKGMRAAVYEERVTGHVEIRQIFKASAIGNIAGSYVKDGTIERGALVRILRKGEKVYEGKLASLKRFKDDVKEVREGFECGLVFDGFNDFEIEDMVEAYKMVEVEPK